MMRENSLPLAVQVIVPLFVFEVTGAGRVSISKGLEVTRNNGFHIAVGRELITVPDDLVVQAPGGNFLFAPVSVVKGPEGFHCVDVSEDLNASEEILVHVTTDRKRLGFQVSSRKAEQILIASKHASKSSQDVLLRMQRGDAVRITGPRMFGGSWTRAIEWVGGELIVT